MGHGTVADEIKGRARAPGPGRARGGDPLDRRVTACAFAPTSTVACASSPRRTRWPCRPRCGSDLALVFDECTPFHVDRAYTAALDRAHPPLARSLPALARRARSRRAAGVRDRAGRRLRGPASRIRPARSPRAPVTASRSAGRSGSEKAQMYEVVAWAIAELGGELERRPRHLLGIGDVDDLIARRRAGHRHVRLRDAHAPGPPRHRARPRPRRALAPGSDEGRCARRRPSRCSRAAPARPAREGFSRAYLGYLARAGELTGTRLITDAQPRVHRAADGRSAAGDPRRAAGRGGDVLARRRIPSQVMRTLDRGIPVWCKGSTGNRQLSGVGSSPAAGAMC